MYAFCLFSIKTKIKFTDLTTKTCVENKLINFLAFSTFSLQVCVREKLMEDYFRMPPKRFILKKY